MQSIQHHFDRLFYSEIVIDTSPFAVETCEDVSKVVQAMETHCAKGRQEIARTLLVEFPNSTLPRILRSMDLVMQLWLALDVKIENLSIGADPLPTAIQWKDNDSLSKIINDVFPNSSYQPTRREAHIDARFDLLNLRKFCGVKVRWTDNLMDHLSYSECDDVLYIFPHKVFLLEHMAHSAVLPQPFIRETLRTLDLLMPPSAKMMEFLIKRNQPVFSSGLSYDLNRAQDLSEFSYWRDRLNELYEVFQRPPARPYQMWVDDRNPVQWWTFWLAVFFSVLTVFFGIISSYTAFKQITLAQQAYELSLLQACSRNDELQTICTR